MQISEVIWLIWDHKHLGACVNRIWRGASDSGHELRYRMRKKSCNPPFLAFLPVSSGVRGHFVLEVGGFQRSSHRCNLQPKQSVAKWMCQRVHFPHKPSLNWPGQSLISGSRHQTFAGLSHHPLSSAGEHIVCTIYYKLMPAEVYALRKLRGKIKVHLIKMYFPLQSLFSWVFLSVYRPPSQVQPTLGPQCSMPQVGAE